MRRFSYLIVTELVNEKPTYAMVNMKGIIFNLEEADQIDYKNWKTLKTRKVMLKDCIRITFS